MTEFDSELAKWLEQDETVKGILEEIKKAATETIFITDRNPNGCSKCSCKHFRTVEVPDYDKKLKMLDWLALRGVGRPNPVTATPDDDKIVVEYKVVYESADAEADS